MFFLRKRRELSENIFVKLVSQAWRAWRSTPPAPSLPKVLVYYVNGQSSRLRLKNNCFSLYFAALRRSFRSQLLEFRARTFRFLCDFVCPVIVKTKHIRIKPPWDVILLIILTKKNTLGGSAAWLKNFLHFWLSSIDHQVATYHQISERLDWK